MAEDIEWRHWDAINTALQSFADAFDRADVDALLALFSPDAVWDHGADHIRQGHESIGAFLSDRHSVYAQTSHHVGPPTVQRDADGSSFKSVAYLIATHFLHDGSTYTGYGRYVSTWCHVGTGLRIARHTVIAHVTRGVSPPVNQLARAIVERHT